MSVNAILQALTTGREVEYVVCAIAINRAVGPDDPFLELLKLDPKKAPAIVKALHGIIEAAWRKSEVSQTWKNAAMKVLCNKEDRIECGNYR